MTTTDDALAAMTAGQINERAHFTEGLRDLADWYDAHPEVPLPFEPSLSIYDLGEDEAVGLATVARAMGRCDKDVDERLYRVVRRFGPIEVKAIALRNQVCERKVVGTRTVEREVEVTPAVTRTETVKVDEVEWVCQPLLAVGDGEGSTS